MKKYALIAAAVAALMTCACSVEPVDIQDVQPEEEGEYTVLTAGFAGAEADTRTVRQADGKVFWSAKDEISVVRGTNRAGKKFVSTNTEPAPRAAFTGTMPSGSGAFWAVHPYSSDAYFDGTYLVTEIPEQQVAIPGTFDDNAFISVAYADANATSLSFYHVCGGLKLSVVDPDITKITLRAHEDRALTGLIGIVPNDGHPAIQALGYAYDYVELAPASGTFQPGAAYHFSTLPNLLSYGFYLFFERKDGAIAYLEVPKSVYIKAAHFVTLMEVDKNLTWEKDVFTYGPESVSVDPLGGSFSIHFRATVDYHMDPASDWIHFESVEGDSRLPEGADAIFKVDQNPGEEREGYVVVCNNKTGNCYLVTVTQGSGVGLKVVKHHSLGMRFTATWCGWCPYMNESFSKAKDLLGDRFDYVNLHASSSDLAFAGTTTLVNQYQVSGYPTGIIDGRVDIENSTDTDAVAQAVAAAVNQQESMYPVQTAVGLETSLSDRTLSVKAQVFARKAGSYKLTVFLLESGVVHYQNGGGNNYVHNRIARMALTAAAGDTVQISEDNGTTSVNFTVTIPSDYDISQMDVLAYVQYPFGDKPVIQSGSYGDWYIDNCRSVALGATAALEVE